jgi:hypothetical protein
VLTDRELAGGMALRGHFGAERFSWESAVERIVDIYDGVA